MKKIMLLLVVCVVFLLTAGCGQTASKGVSAGSGNAAAGPSSGIVIRMLDVGQGDALLIQTGEQTVLIDSGDVDAREKLQHELQAAGVTTIDKLIITHPHADHMGGAELLFQKFTVKEVYDNGQPTTTALYRNYLKDIKGHQIAYKNLKDGDTLDFGNGVSFQVLSPTADMLKTSKDLNGNSIVGRLAYGEFSMLFTGDSETEAEKGMLHRYGSKLKSTLLKAPHHGSKTSSSASYLKAVAPEAVLISLGAGNDYGHPHAATLKRYGKQGCKIYRTDQQGTITVETDGKTYTIKGAK